jgi:Zn-finger nucleic acid-binding protein
MTRGDWRAVDSLARMQMTCPKCHGQMRQYERSGVTVDQCSECRGIFLDRGELERLTDAESTWHGGPAQPAPRYDAPPAPRYDTRQGRYRDHDSDEYPVYGHGEHGRRKKHRGFLEELFD